jgi:hypothetical protein
MLQTPEYPRKPRKTTTSKKAPAKNGSRAGLTFAETLQMKIKTVSGAEVMKITPPMAEEMLRYNEGDDFQNRPQSLTSIRKYAKLMSEGAWHLTGETIIFSRRRLLNGQNRLMACIEANTPFQCLVYFGSADDNFSRIDIPWTRKAAHIFAINGVPNYSMMSAATLWVYGYETSLASALDKGSSPLSHDRLYEKYLSYKKIQDSVWAGRLFKKSRLAAPSMMCGLHYICARKNKAEADEFFYRIGEGLNFSGKTDPAFKLHQALIKNAMAQEKMSRRAIAAITIKAWNAGRDGRASPPMKYDVGESFPRVR